MCYIIECLPNSTRIVNNQSTDICVLKRKKLLVDLILILNEQTSFSSYTAKSKL